MLEPEIQILGGLQGDPGVFLFFRSSGEGVLFDMGSIEALSQRELMKVRSVFISHAHMDHFMGFDRWLRVNVPHKRLLKIWGPAPFFERVQAKLRAYTWNLIDDDQLRFDVHEVQKDGSVRRARLSNQDNFEIVSEASDETIAALTVLQDGSSVSAALLDHKGIVSLAYRIKAPVKLKLKTERMAGLGLKAGPWISELQLRARQGQLEGQMDVEGRSWSLQTLADELLQWEEGPSLGYCTDLSYDRSNLASLAALAPLDRLISESSFLDEDCHRAVSKAHLTARQAALIATHLETRAFSIFHISTIYGQGPEAVVHEAERIFGELQSQSSSQKSEALEAELIRVEGLLASSV